MLFMLAVLPMLSACGYNTIPTAEENAKAAWSEVLNQYQRRADLIPNLVETVKGYASHEKDVLEGVVEARAKATQVTVTPETLSDPEAFKKFQETQSGLTGTLSKLLAPCAPFVCERMYQNLVGSIRTARTGLIFSAHRTGRIAFPSSSIPTKAMCSVGPTTWTMSSTTSDSEFARQAWSAINRSLSSPTAWEASLLGGFSCVGSSMLRRPAPHPSGCFLWRPPRSARTGETGSLRSPSFSSTAKLTLSVFPKRTAGWMFSIAIFVISRSRVGSPSMGGSLSKTSSSSCAGSAYFRELSSA
jgi:hypothetical protein